MLAILQFLRHIPQFRNIILALAFAVGFFLFLVAGILKPFNNLQPSIQVCFIIYKTLKSVHHAVANIRPRALIFFKLTKYTFWSRTISFMILLYTYIYQLIYNFLNLKCKSATTLSTHFRFSIVNIPIYTGETRNVFFYHSGNHLFSRAFFSSSGAFSFLGRSRAFPSAF